MEKLDPSSPFSFSFPFSELDSPSGTPELSDILQDEFYYLNQNLQTIKITVSLLEDISIDILHEMMINLHLKNLYNICLLNKTLNDNICQNNQFWKKKLINDFSSYPLLQIEKKNLYNLPNLNILTKKLLKTEKIWRTEYINIGKTIALGKNN